MITFIQKLIDSLVIYVLQLKTLYFINLFCILLILMLLLCKNAMFLFISQKNHITFTINFFPQTVQHYSTVWKYCSTCIDHIYFNITYKYVLLLNAALEPSNRHWAFLTVEPRMRALKILLTGSNGRTI